MSNEKRRYEKRVRAERQEETRRRIAAATAALHEELGPARTTVAEIARRAGVQRPTVYNNFPDERDLFAACSAHFIAENPLPVLDPAAPLERVLEALYGWYRRTQRMNENVRRDRKSMPALDAVLRGTSDTHMAALADALVPGRSRALVALALDYWTWHRLSTEGLDDGRAARLMAGCCETAVDGR